MVGVVFINGFRIFFYGDVNIEIYIFFIKMYVSYKDIYCYRMLVVFEGRLFSCLLIRDGE